MVKVKTDYSYGSHSSLKMNSDQNITYTSNDSCTANQEVKIVAKVVNAFRPDELTLH